MVIKSIKYEKSFLKNNGLLSELQSTKCKIDKFKKMGNS